MEGVVLMMRRLPTIDYMATNPLTVLTAQHVMMNLHPIPFQHILEYHLHLQQTMFIRKILEHQQTTQVLCWVSERSVAYPQFSST